MPTKEITAKRPRKQSEASRLSYEQKKQIKLRA